MITLFSDIEENQQIWRMTYLYDRIVIADIDQ